MFTEEPYWLEEAYGKAINISDTGIMERNLSYSKLVSVLLYFSYDKNAAFLDYAGGHGIFTRLMRDVGFDFYWTDLYCENMLAKGFEYASGVNKDIRLITAFEVFEHFVNPIEEIEKMLSISQNIAFSTELLPLPIPKSTEWWFYAPEHGQHVSFYSLKTLKVIAKKFRLNYYNYGHFHLLTRQKINAGLFKLLMLMSTRGLFLFIKKGMKSKTWNDHILLKNKFM